MKLGSLQNFQVMVKIGPRILIYRLQNFIETTGLISHQKKKFHFVGLCYDFEIVDVNFIVTDSEKNRESEKEAARERKGERG